ncbi:hypothetical protein GPALN_011710 [Globodera pallida]|nr:hypothetical protein GPALN_011710 [Globodera pallida]
MKLYAVVLIVLVILALSEGTGQQQEKSKSTNYSVIHHTRGNNFAKRVQQLTETSFRGPARVGKAAASAVNVMSARNGVSLTAQTAGVEVPDSLR